MSGGQFPFIPTILTSMGDMPLNFQPSFSATQVGSAAQGAANSSVRESGNMYIYSGPTISPTGTGGAKVVAFFAIPANAFDIAGRTLTLMASGGFAVNANTKAITLVVTATLPVLNSNAPSGTTIASTGAVTTSGAGWAIGAQITKYGNPGSNTQTAVHNAAQCGAAVEALTLPSALTLNESVVNYVAVCLNNTTTNTDSTLALFEATWNN